MSTLKYLLYLITLTIVVSSCTKECCYDGNPISPDEVLDVINSNELKDTLFNASITGSLKNINGKTLNNRTIILTDTVGREFKLVSDSLGQFNLTNILSGKYNLRFENLTLYEYSFEQYNTIIKEITNIYTGVKMASNAEKIAYDVVDINKGISSLDRVYFERFQKSIERLENYQPWRLINRADFDNNNIEIRDNINLIVKDNEAFVIDVLIIYIGDPTGFTL